MTLFSTFNQSLTFWLFCYLGFVSSVVFFATFWLSNFLTKKSILSAFFQKIAKKRQKNAKNDNKKGNLDNLDHTSDAKKLEKLTLKEILKRKKRAEKERKREAKLALKAKIKEEKRIKSEKNKQKKKPKNKKLKSNQKNNQKNIQKNKQKVQKRLEKKAQKRQIALEKRLKRRKKLRKRARLIFKKFLVVIRVAKKYFFVGVLAFVLAVCLIKMLEINLDLNFGEITFFNLFAYFVSFCVGKTFIKLFAKFLVRLYNVFRRRKNEKVNR